MKIGYLLRYYPTLTETFIYTEINGLIEAGFEIEIYALGEREDGAIHQDLPECPVHIVPRSRFRRLIPAQTQGEKWLRGHQRAKDVSRLSWLRTATSHLDHLRVHFAGEAAEVARALHLDIALPYSITTHAVDIFEPRPAWKEVLLSAHFCIAISKYNQRHLTNNGIHAELIPCGIRIEDWPELPTQKQAHNILFIGRDVAKKGLDILLCAMEGLPSDIRLRIISDRASQSTEQIEYFPLMNKMELIKHMQWASVVVLPCIETSTGDRDGIPIVLMEALASGRPIISTALPGLDELITKKVGWVCTENSVQSLNDEIIASSNQKDRNERAANARNHLLNSNFLHKKQIFSLIHLLVTIN